MLFPLILANLKMIYRNRQALFWALVFPLIFVTVFGLFRLDEPPTADLLVVDKAQDQMSQGLVEGLAQVEGFGVRALQTEAEARQELEDGKAGFLIIIPERLVEQTAQMKDREPVGITVLYDRSNSSAPIFLGAIRRIVDETNKRITQAPTLLEVRAEGVQSRQLTYFDFVLPGLVGMGVMTYSIIGVASVIALYREQKILKRILATPLRVRTFFASQIIAYLLLSVAQSLVIIAAGVFIFGGHIYGNLLWMLLLIVPANIVFLNMGFIVGAIARNVRAADGLANAISLPMMFFSGVFFSNNTLPTLFAKLVDYLPLSPLLDAMRGVALEAKPLWEYPTELGMLGAWLIITSVLAIKVFRFD